MRKIAAPLAFIGGEIIKNVIVELDGEGKIISIEKEVSNIDSHSNTEYHNGMLVAGFVNCHCHLEYSYVKGMIPPGGGLPEFIRSIIEIKIAAKTPESTMISEAQKWDKVMASEGVVAVGDHNNNDYVYGVKEQSQICYKTFVEMYDFDGKSSDETFAIGMERVAEHKRRGLDASIVPHANYTMEQRLIGLTGGEKVSDKGIKADGILSIHFKESVAMAGENELSEVVPNLSAERDSILLVHSIYASRDDIKTAKAKLGERMCVVVCPMSNLYIENNIADIDMMLEEGVNITIGTDSLSSNTTLSMLEEVKTLVARGYSLEQTLGWATQNGANALCIADWAGDLKEGLRPGVVLIDGIDFASKSLTEASRAKRLA